MIGNLIDNLLGENGIFWFVDEKENKFNGKLIENKNNYFLETTIEGTSEIKNNNVIVGQINDVKVTIYKIHLWNPFKTWTFLVDYIFINYNYESNLYFKEINLKFFNLEDWIYDSPVNFEFEGEKRIIEPYHDIITFNQNGFDIRFILSYSETHSKTSFCMRSNYSIQLIYADKTKFNDILKDIDTLKKFLTFSMYTPTEIKNISSRIDDKFKPFNNTEIYSRFFEQSPHEINPIEILIEFNNIKDKKDIFQKWFEINKKFKPLFDIYFTNFSNKMNLEYEFLSYSQALESYMRKNEEYNDLYMNEKDYEKIKEDLSNVVMNSEMNDDHKNSWNNRIKFGNEVSLRKRLKDLIDNLKEYDIINKITEGHKNKFINDIVDNRNYYTHYDEKSDFERNVNNLLILNFKLKLIIELCILKEIGFEKEFIDEKLNIKYKYRPIIL